MDCLMSLKAFLAPFKSPKHQKCNTDHGCAADDEASQYAYETGEADTARKVNALLEDLHVDDDDNNEMAWEDIDLEVVEEEAAEVDKMESQMVLELGGMMTGSMKMPCFHAQQGSLASAWHE